MKNSSKGASRAKRLQVPRACTNCRKMHTGCDVERPCKRCVQHGMESSCIDIARRKRVKVESEDDEEEEIIVYPTKTRELRRQVKKELVDAGDDTEDDDDDYVESKESSPFDVEKSYIKKDAVSQEQKSPEVTVEHLVPIKVESIKADLIGKHQSSESCKGISRQMSEDIFKFPNLDGETTSFEDLLGYNAKEILKDPNPKTWDLSALPQFNWNAMKSMAEKQVKEFKHFQPDNFMTSGDFSNLNNEDPAIAQSLNPMMFFQSPANSQASSQVSQSQACAQSCSQPTGSQQYATQTYNGIPFSDTNELLADNMLLTSCATSNFSNLELNFMIQQISELKETNKSLESKLLNISSELVNANSKNKDQQVQLQSQLNTIQQQQQTIQQQQSFILNSTLGQNSSMVIHSLTSQMQTNSTAFSLWRRSNEGDILAECNDRFVQLLGYPMSTLKANFSSSDLLLGITLGINPNEWPKKTKIATSQGMKDVFVTVNGIQGNSKSFIMQLTQVSK